MAQYRCKETYRWRWWRGLAGPGQQDGESGPGHPLSLDERIEIQIGLRRGDGHTAIGAALGRERSVVWREVKRNSGPDGVYHAGMAHGRAAARTRRPKPFKIIHAGLAKFISDNLKEGWSPKLIAAVLARDYREDVNMRISHETIYKCLYVQPGPAAQRPVPVPEP